MTQREILFKGKRKDNGEWVEGDYLKTQPIRENYDVHWIVLRKYKPETLKKFLDNYIEIDPATRCQFWRMLDGKTRLFEGDRFRDSESDYDYFVVEWTGYRFTFGAYGLDCHTGEGGQEVYDNNVSRLDIFDFDDVLIRPSDYIGNIHDKEKS